MPKKFFLALSSKKGVNLGGCKSGARLYFKQVESSKNFLLELWQISFSKQS